MPVPIPSPHLCLAKDHSAIQNKLIKSLANNSDNSIKRVERQFKSSQKPSGREGGYDRTGVKPRAPRCVLHVERLTPHLFELQQVYDYFVKVDVPGGQFVQFETVVPDFKYDKNQPYFDMLVPNVDTVRYSYVMKSLMTIKKPVFFTGITGTGKTSVMGAMLASLEPPPEEGGTNVVPASGITKAQSFTLV